MGIVRTLPELPPRPFKKPRACLPPGDPDWVYQALMHLQFLYNGETSQVESLLEEVERLVEVKAWNVYPPEAPYGSFDTMIRAALGCTLDEFFDEVERRKIVIKAKAAEPAPEAGGEREDAGRPKEFPRPTPMTQEDDNQSNHGDEPRGNRTDYVLSRLARDEPELLERVKGGEITPNGAAVLAGIRKPESSVTLAMRAVRKMDDDELVQFDEEFRSLLAKRGIKRRRKR